MEKMNDATAWVLMIGALFLLTNFTVMVQHEEGHRVIGRAYGCLEDEIDIYPHRGVWRCTEYMDRSVAEASEERFLHASHDSLAHNIAIFPSYLFTAVVGIGLLLFRRKR